MQQHFIRWCSCCLFLFVSICPIYAQLDTVQLHGVVVSAYRTERPEETSIQIEPITIQEIRQSGAFNISDALSKMPGLSQLSTGVAISKPVIHGLYGSRVLVLINGMRFDNQQWQDEHGLGLSEVGIQRVEVIKGPYSVLHGTEAVAGVINIIEEDKPAIGKAESDLGVKLISNTAGGMLQYGYKANYGDHWLRIRVAGETHADYSDGNGTRVLNSRFDGYYLKATYGFQKKNWKSDWNYAGSFNRFGFIFADITDFFEAPDARYSREYPGPHHIVLLNLLNAQNTFYLDHSVLKCDVGLQSNQRMEDEGSGAISLNMHLITGAYTLRWEKKIGTRTDLVFAQLSTLENNTNYGKKRIVPDAWIWESSASAYIKHATDFAVFELGAGGGVRHITSLLTAGVNTPDKDIAPFAFTRPFGNGTAGVSLNKGPWNAKANVSTGVRIANLAELSSNGLHEGVFSYEIGDPDLKNEMNINTDVSITYAGAALHVEGNIFYDHFNNYVYLTPTGEEWFGFPIYRYLQQDADLYGADVSASVTLDPNKHWKLKCAWSGMHATTEDGNYLPFIPADKITPEIRYTPKDKEKLQDMYVFVNCDLVQEQNEIAPEETSTPSYTLLNAGLGCMLQVGEHPVECMLTGNNLLNTAYYDHLSRFKPLGYLNIGTNIIIQCHIYFSKSTKNQIQ
ncbi:MAG: TonB-dependent receptor [Chitinophagales bacterium]